MPVWNDKMAGHHSTSGQVSVNSAFTAFSAFAGQMKSVLLKELIPVVYIRGCMLGSELTEWPPNQILSVHWDTTGQTTLEDHWSHKYIGIPLELHWLMLAPSGVPVAIPC